MNHEEKDFLKNLLLSNCGKICGSILGLLVGIVMIFWGFWKGILFLTCVLGGYAAGCLIDSKKTFKEIFLRFFGSDNYR